MKGDIAHAPYKGAGPALTDVLGHGDPKRENFVVNDGDQVFAEQVLNAIPRYNERGFTLSKARSRGKIDAVIALALGLERARMQPPPKQSVYDQRGVRFVGR